MSINAVTNNQDSKTGSCVKLVRSSFQRIPHNNCSLLMSNMSGMDNSSSNDMPKVEQVIIECSPLRRHSDSDLQANLIQAIKARPPLWNHKIKLKERSDLVKKKLWDEVSIEMNSFLTVDELKSKWMYLKEKYVREKKKYASKGGLEKKQWVHFESLVFLEGVIRHINEESTNISTGKFTVSNKDVHVTCSPTIKKKELEQTRLPEVGLLDDDDLSFSKYLAFILKDLPKKKKRRLQGDIISKVIEEITKN